MTVDAPVHGVVLEGTGGVWRVRTDTGEVVDASLRGRLKQDKRAKLKLAVGDDVRLEPGERGDAWAIAEILPRRSKLARRAPGTSRAERVVASNIDQVIVVFAAAKPEPHPRMLDRFLVIAEANELKAHVVLNKVDLLSATAARELFADHERAGYPIHCTSTKTWQGLDDVHALLAGRRSVVSGPSGVGKSSLLNAMFPGANLRVGEISESVNKGRHTTVGARMLPLPAPDGGYVIDTPGLREVGFWNLPPEELDQCFPELRGLREECRFGNCRHQAEPGCAVLAAVSAGQVSTARYESYIKLREELEHSEATESW